MTFSIEKQVIFNSIMQDLQKEFLPANDGDIPKTTIMQESEHSGMQNAIIISCKLIK
jgi:hypothetical protein